MAVVETKVVVDELEGVAVEEELPEEVLTVVVVDEAELLAEGKEVLIDDE